MKLRPLLMSTLRRTTAATVFILGFPMLWLLEPFMGIRLGLVFTQRIGHLAANTDVFFRGLPARNKGKKRTYILTGCDPANRQLFAMFARSHGIIESRVLTWLLFSCRELLKPTRFWEPLDFTGDNDYLLYNTTEPAIAFTAEEEARGRSELQKMGIGENDWFVGFHCRDSAYLNTWRPALKARWDTLGFKNADITSYLDGARRIADEGGFALRMGAVVDKPLPQGELPDRVLDYASRFRSDFMDIYIAAHCRFFLGSSTGLGHVPTVFNRPVIIANHFPYNHTHYRQDDLIVPRPVVSKETGEPVPFHKAQDDGFFKWRGWVTSTGLNSDLYDWGYNDSEDIENAVLDMLDRLEGREPPAGAAEIQARYAERYLSHLPHFELGAKLSPRYALKYRHLI